MSTNLRSMATFGVAGNFTGHLEQAGEARDFKKVKTAEANAPKAMFPTYIPMGASFDAVVPAYLRTFPFDAERIVYPAGEQKVQIEPECAFVFDVTWDDDMIVDLVPVEFGASNDCSIRKEGAKKISVKKNWGAASKGFSEQRIAVDSFREGGILDDYRIASFLVRDGKAYAYGEDSAVRDYSYFYEKLEDWMINTLNHQQNDGPAEEIHEYLLEAEKPEQIMVSVGATRYTEYGCEHFLQDGDLSVVVVYPESRYSSEEITKLVEDENYSADGVSFLVQKVELQEASETEEPEEAERVTENVTSEKDGDVVYPKMATQLNDALRPYEKRLAIQGKVSKIGTVLALIVFLFAIKVINQNKPAGICMFAFIVIYLIVLFVRKQSTLNHLQPRKSIRDTLVWAAETYHMTADDAAEVDQVLTNHRKGKCDFRLHRYRITFAEHFAITTEYEDREIGYLEMCKASECNEVRVYHYDREGAPEEYSVAFYQGEECYYTIDFEVRSEIKGTKEKLVAAILEKYPDIEMREILE